MKKILYLICVMFLFCSCSNEKVADASGSSVNAVNGESDESNESDENGVQGEKDIKATTNKNEKKGNSNMNETIIEISVRDYGIMQFKLDKKNAPLTVDNFLKLINEKFYNGLTFHRIIKDFMIQGGDPLGDGTGGASERIKGEFIANGVENQISHTRGVISMARGTDYNSASSQFFICHKDATFLDEQYAAFGKILDKDEMIGDLSDDELLYGIEVVDKICDDVPVLDGNGTVSTGDQPIIDYVKVLK